MQNKIQLSNIHYAFPNTNKPVFDGLNFELQKECGLYGVIGPSGVGKTTLITIIGGQLKPDEGSVLINDLDIYNIFDTQRRDLIAYQMQSSTNLRGSVKVNLVFGIYEKECLQTIEDEELINLLKKVGLWKIFEAKNGLDTIIGEGGLNLSGGQRQRLNFASLYLRAINYKPSIILIDEPTSSLDDISEIAITKMIQELAKNAIVFVVAHRLVTIENANGVIDLTLITKSQSTIIPYTKQELLEKSEYYKGLMSKTLLLDE